MDAVVVNSLLRELFLLRELSPMGAPSVAAGCCCCVGHGAAARTSNNSSRSLGRQKGRRRRRRRFFFFFFALRGRTGGGIAGVRADSYELINLEASHDQEMEMGPDGQQLATPFFFGLLPLSDLQWRYGK